VFGGFCLLFLFLPHSLFSRLGGVVVFLPVLTGCLDRIVSNESFCLESLILAQDERWRRA
jgi:hypothetical protein